MQNSDHVATNCALRLCLFRSLIFGCGSLKLRILPEGHTLAFVAGVGLQEKRCMFYFVVLAGLAPYRNYFAMHAMVFMLTEFFIFLFSIIAIVVV